MTILVLVGCLVFAAALGSYALAGSAACLAVAYNVWAWNRAELLPIRERDVGGGRAFEWAVNGLTAIAMLF